jgi:hypothetical protein
MAEKSIDEELAEVNSQITEALRNNASIQERQRLAGMAIHLNIKKMRGV